MIKSTYNDLNDNYEGQHSLKRIKEYPSGRSFLNFQQAYSCEYDLDRFGSKTIM